MATIYYPTTAVVQQRQVSGSTLTEQFIGVLPDQILVFTGSTFFTSSLTASYAYTSSNAYTASYLVGGSRTILTASTTLYVNTTGSDSNNGLSLTTPFQTIQNALNVASSFDNVIYNVTIQVSDGTYKENLTIKPLLNPLGNLTLQGNQSNSSSVIIQSPGSGNTLAAYYGTSILLNNLYLSGSAGGGNLITLFYNAFAVPSNLVYGQVATGQAMVSVNRGGTINFNATTCTIIGGPSTASSFIWSYLGGKTMFSGVGINFVGSSSYSTAFMDISQGAVVAGGTLRLTGSGAVTGKKFSITTNGVIDTGGLGVSYLPGSIAGTSGSGGQYV